MKIAYIMRGVPGSGKSTKARNLAGKDGVIHSTDNYFYIRGKIQENHTKNLKAFCKSLSEEIPVVICDNTNIKLWESAPYVKAAKKSGYKVVFVAMPHPDPKVAAARNTHNVPLYVIEGMIKDWQPMV